MSESGFETSSLDEVEAVLDGMENPTSEDVWHATLPYSDRALASVAAARAGSGGSLPGDGVAGKALLKASSTPGDVAWSTGYVLQRLGPFAVTAADQAALEGDSLVLGELPAGSVVLNSLCVLTEEWAGVTAATIEIGFGALADWGILTRWDILGLFDQNILGAASWRLSMFVTNPLVFPPGFDPAGDNTHFLSQVPAIAVTDVQLRAAGFFTGAATDGAVDIYVVVASPAT